MVEQSQGHRVRVGPEPEVVDVERDCKRGLWRDDLLANGAFATFGLVFAG